MVDCCICHSRVDRTSKALYMKLVDPDAKRFYCMDCLSEYLDSSVDDLLALAEEFKNNGCTLFQ